MNKALHLLNSIKLGGGENVAFNYAKVLAHFNIISTFIGKKKSAEFELLINEYGTVEEKLSFRLLYNADYIFIHSNKNLFKLLLFYFFYLKFSEKKIFYIQHLNYSKRKFIFLSIFINLICTDFIRITPITKVLVEKYIKIKKHSIINFYIPKYTKDLHGAIRNDMRKIINVSNNITLVMYSGVLKPGKGIGDFLRIAELMQFNSNYYFLIVGDGPEVDLIKSYKGNNVLWVGFQNDVEKYLIAADVYLFTSLFKLEMLPVALVEAINLEKNILAFDTDINRFLLINQISHTFEELLYNLHNSVYPKHLPKFNMEYAKEKFHNIL